MAETYWWHNMNQACEALGIDRRTIRKHLARGELMAIRIGSRGDYRFRSDWIEAFIARVSSVAQQVRRKAKRK